MGEAPVFLRDHRMSWGASQVLTRGGVSTCDGAPHQSVDQPLIPTLAIPSTNRFCAKTNITIIGSVASAVPAIR